MNFLFVKYFQYEKKEIFIFYILYLILMQAVHKKINPPSNFTLTCSANLYKIYTYLNERAQSLTLLLYQHKLNKTNIYESIINQSSLLVQSLGGVTNLLDYLQDKDNMYWEDSRNLLRIVSRIQVKGGKREIDIGIIQFKLKEQMSEQQQDFSLDYIQQHCQSNKQIQKDQLNQFLLSIIKYIKSNQAKKIQEEFHELTQPLIKKIVLLGEGQELLKNKLGGISEEIGHLNITISELDIKLQQKQKIVEEISRAVHQNMEKVNMGLDRLQEEIESKILETKQFMYEKIKSVLKQIDQNYEGIKKAMVNQYKYQNRMKEQQIEHSSVKGQMKIEQGAKLFSFSKVLKNNSINLENNCWSASGGDATRGKIILINPSIGSLKARKLLQISLKFKIRRGPTNILIGACNLEKVRALNYKVQKWDTEGHGGYYINSGAYSYSSFREQDNAAVKAFRFKEGDIIKVACNLQKKSLIFSKENEDEKYIMQYDPNLHEDRLYFGVILHGIQSKVDLHQD